MGLEIVLEQFFRAEMFFHIVCSDQSLFPQFVEVYRVPGGIKMSPFLMGTRALCIEITAGDALPVIITCPETDTFNVE